MAKTNLQVLTEKVASAVFGVNPESVDHESMGNDYEQYLKLTELVGQVVLETFQNYPNQSVLLASLKAPTWLQRVRLRKTVKETVDFSGDLRLKFLSGKVSDAYLTELSKTDDKVLGYIIDEALNPNNILI